MARLNVNTVKTRVEQLSRKDQTTGYLDNIRFNSSAEQAQLEEVNFQRTLAQQGYFTQNNLSYLKDSETYVTGTDGRVNVPDDYMYVDAITNYAYDEDEDGSPVWLACPVDILTEPQARERLSDQIDKPTPYFPIAVEYEDHFIVYPFNQTKVVLNYIRVPQSPVWGFTDVNGRQVYNSATSTNFDLPEELLPNIVWRICNYIGVEVRQPDLIQAGMAYLQSKRVGL